VLFGLVDAMGERLHALSEEPTVVRERSVSRPETPARTIRAEVGEMDQLLDLVAETQVELGSFRRELSAVEAIRATASLLVDDLRAPRHRSTDEVLRGLAEEIVVATDRLERGLARRLDGAERELAQVRESAERLRLLPASTLFTTLERTARDAAHAQAKRVEVETRGGEVRLDAQVLSTVSEALVQMVRNAVVHGIESESERAAARKSRAGTVSIEVRRIGRRVSFRCRDDGRGIDVAAVKRAAALRGLGGDDLGALLFGTGISTSQVVTELSGRGVGLDVVRDVRDRLGGALTVETQRGRGTTIELVVPVSLTSFGALAMVGRAGSALVPLDSLVKTLRVPAHDVARSPDGDTISEEGSVPFVELDRLLTGRSAGKAPAAWSVAIVRGAGGRAALGAIRLGETRQVVTRQLPELAVADAIVGGAALDVEGNPSLVLDPDAVVRRVTGLRGARPEAIGAGLPILVIDDSLTTRMLEQSILESAGYEVDLATSAEEGLEKALGRRYGLFLVDVEMPGMDGFDFVQRVRGDPELGKTPAILVTSRGSAEDRERGRVVGAADYVVKSEFDQAMLLDRIRELTQ
jgi:two-component system chemotaxis sensor kinase CheA